MSSTLTSKGQVTIPKTMRDDLGLKPGSAVEFEFAPDGCIVIKPAELDGAHTADAEKRLASGRGSKKLGIGTDEYMSLIRGYDEDATDPGFRA